MSRYATLMQPSTAPPSPAPEDTSKHPFEGSVLPAKGTSVVPMAITSAPTEIAPNPALREDTVLVEPELEPVTNSEISMPPAAVDGFEPTMNRTNERKIERSNERRIKRTVKRANDEPNERTKVRHTFDILDDQLLTLREISIERQKFFGRRVLLGELVQEALDLFISKERNTV